MKFFIARNRRVLAISILFVALLSAHLGATLYAAETRSLSYSPQATAAPAPAEGSHISITTSRNAGEQITLKVKVAEEAAEQQAWVDLNGNKICDDGETVSEYGRAIQYTVSNQMINVYGSIIEFDCSENALTAMDLSACPSLLELYCLNNDLTTLDLSKCGAISILDCSFNQLTSLLLPASKSLSALVCSNNKLSKLDLSSSHDLQRLYCTDNLLTELSVKDCPSLNLLYCSNNQLQALDISTTQALTLLDCRINQISSLDLAAAPELFLIECGKNSLTKVDVSKNEKLLYLYCYDNQLTTVDVSANKLLNTLDCAGNNLQTIDLSHNPDLVMLCCASNHIRGEGMIKLIQSLPNRAEADTPGVFYIINNFPSEANVCLKSDVALAHDKNWQAYYYPGSGDDIFEYEGSELITYRVSKDINGGGDIVIKGWDDLDEVPEGTELTVEVSPQKGYTLGRLMAGDEDITATKRFTVHSDVVVSATFVLGIEDISSRPLEVYANSAEGYVTVSGAAQGEVVRIYSAEGVMLGSTVSDGSETVRMDLGCLSDGVYIVRVFSDLRVYTSKVIVR